MDILLRELKDNEALQSILHKQSNLGNLSLSEEALLLAAAFKQQPKNLFVIKNNTYTAQKLYERLTTLLEDDVLLFVMEDSLRVEAIAASPESKANQMESMAAMMDGKPRIVVLNTAAAIRYMPSPEVFQQHFISLKTDQEIEYDDLKALLFEAGYTYVNRVDQPLCYAARGGIIDVYSMNYEHPLRIEFFDNIIDSIRFFDISTQRTIEVIKEAHIVPASDLLFTDKEIACITERVNEELSKQETQLHESYRETLKNRIDEDLDAISNRMPEARLYRYYAYLDEHATIFDYMQKAWIIVSSKEEVKEANKHILEENIAYLQELFQEGQALYKFQVFEELNKVLAKHQNH